MNEDQETVAAIFFPLLYISTFIQEKIDEHRAYANGDPNMKVNPEMQQMKLRQVASTQARMDEIQQEISALKQMMIADTLEYMPLSSVKGDFLQRAENVRNALKKLVTI